METEFQQVKNALGSDTKRWLVTGAAGFIGSNLVEALLELNQEVVGLDNFSTGKRANLEQIKASVEPRQWQRLSFHEGDIRNLDTCRETCQGVDYVLHQAALGSVPRSIDNPLLTHENNVTGHLNVLVAARDAHVKRVVYAASSSTYGDHPGLPKVEHAIGRLLSPYAVSKYVNELYADVFAMHYGIDSIGLRYFNVFGPRQARDGAYAAVIPMWVASMMTNEPVFINGTGDTSRDFCYVANAVQADILAAVAPKEAGNQVYNIALNQRTTLNQLFEMIRLRLATEFPHLASYRPRYREYRAGDIMHSQADISKAAKLLGYQPTHTVEQGLDEALSWYKEHVG